MGNALRHVRGESQKNIVRFIEGLSGKYSRWDIWQDFIIMSAVAIANTMGGPQAKAREEMYRSRAEKYCRRGYEVALARLASYEATELMPDEIVKMGMMFEDSKRYSGRLELKLNAAAKRMPKWVSVKERLPEDRSNVLVVAYWHERWGVYMGWCAPERAKWSVHVGIGDRDDVAVTYWMPLPEPPKEDDRND